MKLRFQFIDFDKRKSLGQIILSAAALCLASSTVFALSLPWSSSPDTNPADKSDYTDEWQSTVDQGHFGTCSVFATIGLLEAEYYRTFKQEVHFSEGDLFEHVVMGSSKEQMTNIFFAKTVNDQARSLMNHDKEKFPDFMDDLGAFGGGDIAADFITAQGNGLKTEDISPYADATQYFLELRTKMRGLKAPAVAVPEEKSTYEYLQHDPYTYGFYANLVRSENAKMNEILDTSKNFKTADPQWLGRLEIGQINLESLSVDQKRGAIVKLLTCKPVGVEMSVKAYPFRNEKNPLHAQIIVGYDPSGDEFEIKNSWGRMRLLSRYDSFSATKYLRYVNKAYFINDPKRPCKF